MRSAIALAVLFTSTASAYDVEVLQSEGDPANRVDLVILGDGYRVQDQAQLTDDASSFLAEMWAEPPFQQYQGFFNVKLVHVISNENGADDGSYGADRDTALGAHYFCGGIERLLCVNRSAVRGEAGAHVPEYDHILVVVNDPKYGGSGGSFAVFSIHSSSGQIAIHELGHSFSGLADEYESAYPGYPQCTADCPEPNVTNHTVFDEIKWSVWMDPATPLPTPETADYSEVVGLFEGARYESVGVFRPRLSCMMRSLGRDFCEVCSEAGVLATYDRVDPIDAAAPPTPIAIARGETVPLSIARPLPVPDTDALTWSVDGTVAATGQEAFDAVANVLGPGDHEIVFEVMDQTALVRTDPAGLLVSERSWTVTVCPGRLDPTGTNACGGPCELSATPGEPCDGSDADFCADDAVECDGLNGTTCSTGADNGDACDGLDNDCDGVADNDGSNACGGSCALTAVPGAACDGVDADLCADDIFVCIAANETVCSIGADNGDACDGLDNDCDGIADNDGSNACGGSCALEAVPGAGCDGPDTDLCADDRIGCDGPNATSCSLGGDDHELCDGSDNDCDGETDEGFGVGTECTVGVGACAAAGVRVCASNGRASACAAEPGPPGAEVCNGVDDDCDGVIDDPGEIDCPVSAADAGGCGCRVASAPPAGGGGAALLLMLVGVLRTRASRVSQRPARSPGSSTSRPCPLTPRPLPRT